MYNVPRQKPSPLFVLLGWRSIPVMSPMMQAASGFGKEDAGVADVDILSHITVLSCRG
jgi:hypothetical protein